MTILFFFFFNDTATTEIYTLSLHDALPGLRNASFAPHCARVMIGGAGQLGRRAIASCAPSRPTVLPRPSIRGRYGAAAARAPAPAPSRSAARREIRALMSSGSTALPQW